MGRASNAAGPSRKRIVRLDHGAARADPPRVHVLPRDTGWIEGICGPMFSGQTDELNRRLRRAQIARQRVQIFKPRLDDRYAPDALVSHSTLTMESTVV